MKRNKKLTIAEYEFSIVIQEEKKGGYVATCPLWSDCYAQGETVEEAISEIAYVASSLIELYKEEKLHIPLKLKKTTDESATHLRFTFPLVIST